MKWTAIFALVFLIIVSCKPAEVEGQVKEAKATIADTTSIRIVSFSTDPVNNLFHFDSTATGWTGTLYRYQVGANNVANITDIRTMVPKNDWLEFNDFVGFLKIFEIPDQKDLTDFTPQPNPKNVRIQFELSRKGKTRMYVYDNPAAKPGSHWTTDNINTFISYITQDFNFVRPN